MHHHQGTQAMHLVILPGVPGCAVRCLEVHITICKQTKAMNPRTWGTIACFLRNLSLVLPSKSSRPWLWRNRKKGSEFSWNASTPFMLEWNMVCVSTILKDKMSKRLFPYHWARYWLTQIRRGALQFELHGIHWGSLWKDIFDLTFSFSITRWTRFSMTSESFVQDACPSCWTVGQFMKYPTIAALLLSTRRGPHRVRTSRSPT